MSKKLLAANWKMNLNKISALELTKVISEFDYDSSVLDIAIFPPCIFVDAISSQFKKTSIILGAQNCCYELSGAFTGEISPLMLKELGCEYVIIGHSERRIKFFETNDLICKKVLICQDIGLHPILCVGEPVEIYKNKKALEFILNQLSFLISNNIDLSDITLAYEPIWSIGTGLIPRTEEISLIINEIKNITLNRSRVLYGGSVNSENISSLINVNNIDGFLVGNASLNPKEFKDILEVYQSSLFVSKSISN